MDEKNISSAVNPLLNSFLRAVAVVNALAYSHTKKTWPILHDGELHQNTLLTSLIPDYHWSAGWAGRGGGLLELCVYKRERRVLQQSHPGEPSNSRGEGGQLREREQSALCNCHAGCSALCLALGAAEERERERETETEWENEIEPITIDRARGIHP